MLRAAGGNQQVVAESGRWGQWDPWYARNSGNLESPVSHQGMVSQTVLRASFLCWSVPRPSLRNAGQAVRGAAWWEHMAASSSPSDS